MAKGTTIRSYTKNITLSYLQTIQVWEGSRDVATLGGTTRPLSGFSSVTKSSSDSGVFGIGASSSSSSKSKSFTDSGWYINQNWLETFWDKARYAVGIKEVGIHNFTYSEACEIVSVPYNIPAPIAKVSLLVDESIPDEFFEIASERPWIEYFFKIGENDWFAIQPINQNNIRYAEGSIVPKIFNINQRIPIDQQDPLQGYFDIERNVHDIRFRAVLRRPTEDQLVDGNTYSPVLKSYRLQISVQGGSIA